LKNIEIRKRDWNGRRRNVKLEERDRREGKLGRREEKARETNALKYK
jgi:hypothetical protein